MLKGNLIERFSVGRKLMITWKQRGGRERNGGANREW